MQDNGTGRKGWIKWLAAGMLGLAVVWVLMRLPVADWLAPVASALMELGPVGMTVYAGLYLVATLLLLPGSAFTIGAGLMFGLVWGTVTVSIASTLAVALSFLIARYAARNRVAAMAGKYPRFGAIDRAVGKGGWRIVGLLRLSPVLPFALQNYAYGLTRIRFWPCVLTSWIAMLPGTLLYVYIGYLARAGVAETGDDKAGAWQWALRLIGFAATVAVTVYITRLARKALREEVPVEADGTNPYAVDLETGDAP